VPCLQTLVVMYLHPFLPLALFIRVMFIKSNIIIDSYNMFQLKVNLARSVIISKSGSCCYEVSIFCVRSLLAQTKSHLSE
jgi:hypothetical protein